MFREYSQALKDCNVQLEETRALRKRAQADLVNYQQEVAKQRSDYIRYGAAPVVRELVPFMSSIDRSKKAMEDHPDLLRGQELLEAQFKDVLTKHGAAPVAPAVGDQFDPMVHEAISAAPAPEKDLENTISMVIEPGVAVHDRMVVPAKVMVFTKMAEAQSGMSGYRGNPRRNKRDKSVDGLLAVGAIPFAAIMYGLGGNGLLATAVVGLAFANAARD